MMVKVVVWDLSQKKNNIRNERNPFAQFLRLVSSSKMNEDEGQFVRTQQKSIIQVKKKKKSDFFQVFIKDQTTCVPLWIA